MEKIKLRGEKISNRIAFLDYLRVFASISVLIGHKFNYLLDIYSNNPDLPVSLRSLIDLIRPLVFGGGAGVIVFFLVSGYIITHILQKENTRAFLIDRIFRIYPLYIVVLIMENIITLGGEMVPLKILICKILLIGDFFPVPYSLGMVEWTLRIEIVFYLLMAVLKLAGVFDRPKWLIYFFILFVIILHFIPLIPNEKTFTYGYLNLYMPFLFIGSCICLAQEKYITKMFCFISCCFIYCSYLYFEIEIKSIGKGQHFAFYGIAIFFAAFYFRNLFISYRVITLLSAMTYSIYLLHNWIFEYLLSYLDRYSPIHIFLKLQTVIFLLLISYLLTVLVEKNSVKFGKQFSNKFR